MKEISAKTSNIVKEYKQSAAWYRALTLTERLAGFQDHLSSNRAHSETAIQKLKRWQEQEPFSQNLPFSRRLALDNLSEDTLLTLLSEPAEALQVRIETPPSWLQELFAAFEEEAITDIFVPLAEITDQTSRAFLSALEPLFKRGLARLELGIETLVASYPHLPIDRQTIVPLLFKHGAGVVLPIVSRTFVLELNVARVQGRLQGETPEQRFHDFFQQMQQPENILALLMEYPVLARCVMEAIENWVNCDLLFLARLGADWEQIRNMFAGGNDPGVLVEASSGAGDMHRGGQSVSLLTWSSGFRLVYKPRSLAVDLHFQELLLWLNGCGFQPAFRTLKILKRELHGWCEFVSAQSCNSAEEIARFYQRQGGYLAILYILEAADFHAENLIAAGEYPMLIDLEGLFQPRPEVSADVQGYYGNDAIGHSVLRADFLPRRNWSSEEAAGIDFSGLGGQAGQVVPVPAPAWKAMGSDQMYRGQTQIELKLGKNRPRLHDQDVDTVDYREDVVTGFTNVYRLFLRYRQELQNILLPRFANDETRALLRPSQLYALLVDASLHPNMLRDGLDRARLFDRLWMGVEVQPGLSRAIQAERADMEIGDIPVFTTCPGTRDLFTAYGECIPAFFKEASIELVRTRIQQLDERDLERQIWIIQASFTSMMLGGMPKSKLQLQPSQTRATYERLLAEARAIGDRLQMLAISHEDTVGWLGITHFREREWQLMPTDTDLYSGLSGIILFLAYLGSLTGEKQYTSLARKALQSARNQIRVRKVREQWGCIGAFDGLSGFIYLLSHLGALWHEPELYREAEEICAALPDLIDADEFLDVIAGSAGCIAALLSLYAVAPSASILELALKCGDRLLAHISTMPSGIGWCLQQEKVPLTGLAHGNAGIALSLLRLAAVSKEERFREAAVAALEYERSLFSEELQCWPDLRGEGLDTYTEQNYMVAWCHGAVGIGLTRLAMLRHLQDAALHAEIDAAFKTTLAHGFGRNHSLCHGDMGNLELIQEAARQLPDPYYAEQFKRLVPMLLDSMSGNKWLSGIPLGVEAPGLMVGLAGTGYALLRLAAAERVPSVLVLDPPIQA